jgi:hypothetical protein
MLVWDQHSWLPPHEHDELLFVVLFGTSSQMYGLFYQGKNRKSDLNYLWDNGMKE